MLNYDEDINQIISLLNKLEDTFHEFREKHPAKSGYANAEEVVFTAMAKAFCQDDAEKLRKIEQLEHDREAKRNPKIDLSVTPIELSNIILGLIFLKQSRTAEKYVKESIATGTTNEQRWSKVAEIMLIKDPSEKLSLHGTDELIWYSVLIKSGKTPRQASEEVFKKFSFNSLEACDKWLRREIEKYQKSQQSHWFCELPKPSTAPRTK